MKKKALLVALCLMFSLSLFAACDHTHTAGSEWKSDATNHWHVCTDCGEVVDSAAHTWNEGEVIEAATCNKEGSMKYTCTVCSATKTEPIEKTAHVVGDWQFDKNNHWHVCTDCDETVDSAAHTWNEGEVIEAATCNKEGSMKYTCTVCSATKTETIEKTAHVVGDWKFDKNDHWQVCENCEAVVNKAAHSLTDNGNGQKVCDCGYSEAIPVQPDAAEVKYVGTYSDCTVTINQDAQFIRDGGSSIKVDTGSANQYWGTTLITFKNFDAWNNAPTFDNWVGATLSFWVYNPNDFEIAFGLHTASEPDMGGGVVAAAANGWSQVTLTYHGDPGAYNYLKVRTSGSSMVFYMDGITFTEGDEIEVPEVPEVPEGVEADAYEQLMFYTAGFSSVTASYDMENVYAGAAGNTSIKYVSTSAGQHDFMTIKSDAIDMTDGSISDWNGATVSFWARNTSVTVMHLSLWANGEQMGGDWAELPLDGNWIKVSFTVDKATVSKLVLRCSVNAGYTFWIDGMKIEALHTHTLVKVDGQAATCTVDGWKDYYTCSDCDKIFADAEANVEITDLSAWKAGDGKLTATGHTVGEWKSDAENHWKVCSVCNEKVETAAHTWNEGVVTKAASCVEEGKKVYTCTVCGATKEETIAIADHAWNAGDIIRAATCSAEGLKKCTCTVCNVTAEIVIERLDHIWDNGVVVTPATCSSEGELLRSCTNCTATVKEVIAKTSHTAGDTVFSDADRHWNLCTVCGAMTNIHEHEGGTATCQVKANCAVCGVEYGKFASHVAGEEWLISEKNHWKTCTVCGLYLYHEKHAFVANGEGSICEVCQYESNTPVTPDDLSLDAYEQLMAANKRNNGIVALLSRDFVNENATGGWAVKYTTGGGNYGSDPYTVFLIDYLGLQGNYTDTGVTDWVGAKVSFWVYNPNGFDLTFDLYGSESDVVNQTAAANGWTKIVLTSVTEPVNKYYYITVVTAGMPAGGFDFYVDGLTFSNWTPENAEYDAYEPALLNVIDSAKLSATASKFVYSGAQGNASIKYKPSAEGHLEIIDLKTASTDITNGAVTNWDGVTISFRIYSNAPDGHSLQPLLVYNGQWTQHDYDISTNFAGGAYSGTWAVMSWTVQGNPDKLSLWMASSGYDTFYIDDFKISQPEYDAYEQNLLTIDDRTQMSSSISTNAYSGAQGNVSVKYTSLIQGNVKGIVLKNGDWDVSNGAITNWNGATITFRVYSPLVAGDHALFLGLGYNGADPAQGTHTANFHGAQWEEVTLVVNGTPDKLTLSFAVSINDSCYIDGFTITEGATQPV